METYRLTKMDKLYLMLPEFTKVYDKDKAREDYNNYIHERFAEEQANELISSFKNWDKAFEDIPVEAPKEWKEWWKENKIHYFKGFEKIKFNPKKDIFEQSREARNNYLIDLMYGVFNTPEAMAQMLNPGGFPTVIDTGRIYTILANNDEKTLAKGLKDLGVTIKGSIEETLLSLDSNTLKELSNSLGEDLDPLSPLTQVTLQQRNMAGANMIGMYANHNSHHALMQWVNLVFTPKNPIRINGKSLNRLNDIRNGIGQYISKNVAEFLASSVDNAKNPSLNLLNQNEFTVNSTMLLVRMGYTIQEAGLFMQQPIIVEMTKRYLREKALGGYVDADKIIGETLNKYRDKAAAFPLFNFKTWSCPITDLAKDIMLEKEAVDTPSQTNNGDLLYYYGRQVAVGYMFRDIYKGGEDLRTLMDATKQDTVGGAVGPTIGDSLSKIFKVKTLKGKLGLDPEAVPDENWTLAGADIILQQAVNYEASDSEMLEFFMNLDLPYLEAFAQLGVVVSERMFKKLFPHYRQDLQNLLYRMTKFNKRGSLSAKTVKSIFSDYFAYALSEIDFFHGTEQRKAFIEEFPAEFDKIVRDNPDIASISFIQMIVPVLKSRRNPLPYLKFKRVGQLTSSKKTKFMQEWEGMLRSDNPKCVELALNLFRYCYYRNGFEFGPNSFIHLASVVLKKAVPGYIDKLRTLTEETGGLDIFEEQYIRNHLDNTQLVHPIQSEDLSVLNVENQDGTLKASFTVDVTQTIPYALSNNGPLYQYIAVKSGSETVYYKEVPTKDENIIGYIKIDRLGIPNEFLEYDFGNPDIKSIIPTNDMNTWETQNTNRVDSGKDEVQIDYGTMPIESGFEGMKDLSTTNVSKIKVSASVQVENTEFTPEVNIIPDEQIPLEAYKDVYGEYPEEGYTNSDGGKLMHIPVIERPLDANEEYACTSSNMK